MSRKRCVGIEEEQSCYQTQSSGRYIISHMKRESRMTSLCRYRVSLFTFLEFCRNVECRHSSSSKKSKEAEHYEHEPATGGEAKYV